MPTRIYFNAPGDKGLAAITVKPEPGAIYEAFTGAEGWPFEIESQRGDMLWLNPSNVAYWREVSGEPKSGRA